MSIHNRNIKKGTQKILIETKFQNFLAKIYCLVFGHKSVVLKTPKFERNYCVCCWKETDK